MGPPQGATLAERLARERRLALDALERDAQAAELRDRAHGLGHVLREAGEDERLWRELDVPSTRARDLTDEQRMRLRAVVSIDWPPLLDQLGYEPPPPSEVLAYELTSEVRRAIEGVPGADVAGAREHLLALAEELIRVSGQAAPERSRLRRLLRRGARVAGPVLVLAGVTAAVLALLELAPVAGALAAAAQWGPIAAAVEAVAEVPLLGEVAKELATGALVDGAKRLVGKVLRRGRKRPEDADDEKDPVEKAALAALAQMDHAGLGGLAARWDGMSMQVKATRQPQPGHLVWETEDDLREKGKADVRDVPLARETIDATRELQQTQMQALFLLWDAATGADWMTPELHHLLSAYFEHLQQLEAAIAEEPLVDFDAADAGVQGLIGVGGELRRRLDAIIGDKGTH